MTTIDATFLSNLTAAPAPDLPPAALRHGLPLAHPRLALDRVRKSIAVAGDDGPKNHTEPDVTVGLYGYLAMGCADDVFGSDSLDGNAVVAFEADGIGDPSGLTLSISANDNNSDAATLRARGGDPAVVIGLALRHARFGSGDVPFAIVCALHRHAIAGDGGPGDARHAQAPHRAAAAGSPRSLRGDRSAPPSASQGRGRQAATGRHLRRS